MSDTKLHRAVGRIEGKVDAILAKLEDGGARHDRLDERVVRVERKVHWFSGAAAVIGAAAGYLFHR